MSGKNINLGDKKIKANNFKKSEKLFKIDDIDVDNILASKSEAYDTIISIKCFTVYDYNHVVRPLCIKLLQVTGYGKCLDSNRTMSFEVADKKLLKKYTKILVKVSSLIGKEFDNDTVYGNNDKYIKTKKKKKIYGVKVNTNFQGKKIQKENTSCKCLSLIMLDYITKVNEKFSPQTLLEECKHEKIKQNQKLSS